MGKRKAIVPCGGPRYWETVIGTWRPRERIGERVSKPWRQQRFRYNTRRGFTRISPATFNDFYHSIWGKP